MWIFDGDSFIDANGVDVTDALRTLGDKADVAWPVKVMHTPCERAPECKDYDVVVATGKPVLEFTATDYAELDEYQFDKFV